MISYRGPKRPTAKCVIRYAAFAAAAKPRRNIHLWKTYARVFLSVMNEATEQRTTDTRRSELDLPQWSVVSFDACEGAGLTYAAAAQLLADKEAAGVYGLCIITDEAARRLN